MAKMPSLWEAIDSAYKRGLGGLTLDAPLTSDIPKSLDNFISLELEEPYSIPWRITLANWRWANLPATGFVPDPNFPIDNQVDDPTPLPARVRVEWGVKVQESAEVDYPWGGCSFTVHGRFVRVYVDNAVWIASQNRPRLGAFASPMVGGGTSGGPVERPGPRFTYPVRDVNIATPGLFAVPERAVAYRLYYDNNTAVTLITASQQNVAQTQFYAVDFDPLAFAAGDSADNSLMSSSSRWYALDPRCTLVVAQPAQDGLTVGCQFMLDLG